MSSPKPPEAKHTTAILLMQVKQIQNQTNVLLYFRVKVADHKTAPIYGDARIVMSKTVFNCFRILGNFDEIDFPDGKAVFRTVYGSPMDSSAVHKRVVRAQKFFGMNTNVIFASGDFRAAFTTLLRFKANVNIALKDKNIYIPHCHKMSLVRIPLRQY